MTDIQAELARIGLAIAHAEALQKAVEAAQAKMEAEGVAQQKTVAQLLLGVDARSTALGEQEQRLAQQILALAAQTEKLGAYAFAGGKIAVQEEVRAALKDASSVVGDAAREATAPVKDALSAGAAAIGAAQEFSRKRSGGFPGACSPFSAPGRSRRSRSPSSGASS